MSYNPSMLQLGPPSTHGGAADSSFALGNAFRVLGRHHDDFNGSTAMEEFAMEDFEGPTTATPTSKADLVASETASGTKEAIVIPSMSVEGRINDTEKPEIHVKTYADTTLLHITAEGNKTSAFSIDVDLHRLVGLNDKTHDAPIPADVFHGTVDGVNSPTGRFQHPTEEGWEVRFDCAAVPSFWCAVHVTVEKVSAAVYEEKLSGIKRSIDAVEDESPVKATPTAMPPPPSPVDATPSPMAPSSQPPKISRTMSCAA